LTHHVCSPFPLSFERGAEQGQRLFDKMLPKLFLLPSADFFLEVPRGVYTSHAPRQFLQIAAKHFGVAKQAVIWFVSLAKTNASERSGVRQPLARAASPPQTQVILLPAEFAQKLRCIAP
jgi:hypothetical protein